MCGIARLSAACSYASPSVEENGQDKPEKCRPVIETFLEKASQLHVPCQYLSLDESQILCCGRNVRCAHRRDKHIVNPLKDYVRAFGLHESGTGYCVKFVIDARIGTTTRQSVHKLVEPIVSRHQPYKVVTDRHYTSVDTARSLQEERFSCLEYEEKTAVVRSSCWIT